MKKALFDFFPVIVFFVFFKLKNIFVATGALMVASCIQIGYLYFRYRKVEAKHIITLVLVLVFGGATIYFHDARFIQWKVSIINWLFGVILFISPYLFKKSAMEYLLSDDLELHRKVWVKLNHMWAIFFIIVGFLNLYVMFNYSQDAWVNFKTFGLMILVVIFCIIQSLYLYKHINPNKK
ncbi:septation protein A [Thiotrichales bacterium 19S3-7]|nr:septation protein A [Thiotrichales bacterium 19S3-7]MCF6801821.1 septation protein A [Thiotrichales bacterium 19S3-11]